MVLDGEEVSIWGLYFYWAQPVPRITICLRDSVHDIDSWRAPIPDVPFPLVPAPWFLSLHLPWGLPTSCPHLSTPPSSSAPALMSRLPRGRLVASR